MMIFLGKGAGGGGREGGRIFKDYENTYLNLMTWVRSPGIEIWDTFVHSEQTFLPSSDVRC